MMARCFIILSSHLPEPAGYHGPSGALGYSDTNSRGDGPSGDEEMGCNLPLVDVGNYPAVAVIAGYSHTCGLLDLASRGTQLKCWGATLTPFPPDASFLSKLAGGGLELEPGGVLTPTSLTPGRNSQGQLGYGDRIHRGDGNLHAEMGFALPFVNFGSGKSVAFAAAGFLHTCAALRPGFIDGDETINELKCWGTHSPSLPTLLRGRTGCSAQPVHIRTFDMVAPADLIALSPGR